MTVSEFAERYGLRVERFKQDDEENYLARIVRGRPDMTHIYEWANDGSRLGVTFCTDEKKAPRTGLWKKFQQVCLDAGMTPVQVGDAEGSFLFDPANDQQARAAIKAARARKKKRVSPERRLALAGVLAAARAVRVGGSETRV
jgi:hypothetical protein